MAVTSGGLLDVVQLRAELAMDLKSLIKRHRQVPMAMGYGKTCLNTKAKLMVMNFFREPHTSTLRTSFAPMQVFK